MPEPVDGPPGHPPLTIVDRPSPNHGERKGGARPDMVILHFTDMVTAEAALDRLCDPGPEVSAHYLIAEDGRCWRLVAEDRRAWHAGVSRWGGIVDVNSHSIGIELANQGSQPNAHPFPEAQMTVLERLLGEILPRWSIPAERVLAHSDIAPGRKYDPGSRFDWRRLALSGLSVWPEGALSGAAAPGETAICDALGIIGYDRPHSQETLEAFRLRFAPHLSGAEPSAADLALAQAVASRWPVIDGSAAGV